jgi:transposase
MRNIREVLRLSLHEGLSLRQIGASLAISPSALGDYLRRAKRAGVTWPLPEDLSDDALETLLFPPAPTPGPARPMPDWGYVHLELRREHVTLTLLFDEYRERHPDGYGYSQFCTLYRRFAKKVDVTMRFTHKAGERMFVDFAGSTMPIWDEALDHVVTNAQLFVTALGVSGLVYAEALPSQELIHWTAGHDHAFSYYGGVPALVVCDNLLSGVTKAHRYEPRVNATYQEMATHYATAILPTRVRKPRDKAKAEGSVLLVSRWILARLRNHRFTSIDEANVAIGELLERVNDKPFKVLPGSRRSVFEEIDRPALRPLPAHPYDFATWKRAKVAINYHVEIRCDRHHYSVPYRLAGEQVEIRLSSKTVEVFAKGQRVASHPRSYTRFGYSTVAAHMPDAHRRYLAWTPERIVNWANKTGPATAALTARIMKERPHPEQGYRTCLGIIRLEKTYGAQRLEAACERALHIHSHTYRTVESILKNGLDKKPLVKPSPRTHSRHEFVRGAGYYQ